MAEKHIVRQEIVQIGFEVDNDPVKQLEKELDDLRKNIVGADIDDAVQEIANSTKEITKEAQEANKAFSETTRQVKETSQAFQGMKHSTHGLKDSIGGIGEESKRLPGPVEKTRKSFRELAQVNLHKLKNGLDQVSDSTLKLAHNVSTKALSGFKTFAKGSLAAVGGVTAALGGIAYSSVKTGMEFEAGMSEVVAISGASTDELAKLTAKAQEMGTKTKFSASESAEAFQYMAMAGWKTEDMLNGIEGVMNLSAASGEDLALTSDIVTDALSAFGLEAKDATHFADVLAKTASSSNTNVAALGNTFKYVAPVAGALGYEVEDLSVAIGLMANRGIKGEQAGTALRGILTNLVKPTDQVAGYMKQLGLSVKNSAGQVKPFNQLMVEMRQAFQKIDQADYTEFAAGLAGQEGMSGLLNIINATDQEFNELAKSIRECDGAALQMSDIMQDNLKGHVTQLGSALEGFKIKFYESVDNPLKSLAESATKRVERLTNAFSKDGFSGFADAFAKEMGEVMESGADAIAEYSPKIVEAGAGIISKLAAGVIRGAPKILPAIASGVGQIAVEIGNALRENAGTLLDAARDTGLEVVRALYEAVSGKKMSEGTFAGMKNALTGILDLARSAAGFLTKHFKTISTITLVAVGSMKAYNLAIRGHNKYLKIKNGLEKANAFLIKKSTAAIGAQTVTTKLAGVAQKALGGAMKALPWAVAAAGALAFGIGLAKLLNYFSPVQRKMREIRRAIEENTRGFKGLRTVMSETTAVAQDYDNMLSGSGKTLTQIDEEIAGIEQNITGILQRSFGENRKLRDDEIQHIKDYQTQLRALEQDKLGIYQDKQQAIVDKLELELESGGIDQESISKNLVSLQDVTNTRSEQQDEIYTSQLSELNRLLENQVITPKEFSQRQTEVYNANKAAQSQNKQAYPKALQSVLDETRKNFGFLRDLKKISELSEEYRKTSRPRGGDYKKSEKAFEGYQKIIVDFDTSKVETANVFLDTIAQLKESGTEISAQVKNELNTMLSSFENLQPQFKDGAKQLLLSITDGMEETIPELQNAAEMGLDEIVGSMRDYFGVESNFSEVYNALKKSGEGLISNLRDGALSKIPGMKTITSQIAGILKSGIGSIDLKQYGANIVNGLVQGIKNGTPSLGTAASMMGNTLTSFIKQNLQIRSPSRVMRELGEFTGEGFNLGLASKNDELKRQAENISYGAVSARTPESSPTTYTTNRNSTVSNNYAPQFNLAINGDSDRTLERKVSRWVKDGLEQFVTGMGQTNPRVREV